MPSFFNFYISRKKNISTRNIILVLSVLLESYATIPRGKIENVVINLYSGPSI